MSEILLRADDARGLGTKVTTAANNAQSDFRTLRSELGALADSFRGKSADAFDAKYTEWETSATALIDALDGLGMFLNGAADTIEDTDGQIAGQLA